MTIKELSEHCLNTIKALGNNWFYYLSFFVVVNIFRFILMPMKESAMISNTILEIVTGVAAFLFAFDCFEKLQGYQNNISATWTEGLSRMPRVILIALGFSLLFFAGLVALVIPALIVIALFALAPLVPLFEPGTAKPFKRSKELVMKAPYFAGSLLIIATLFEFIPVIAQGIELMMPLKFTLMFISDIIGLLLLALTTSLYFCLMKKA